MHKEISIKGARVNNLKNIDITLPLNQLICFFGPSGSGKSSIAFHTLFTESKRRFLNSFPSYLKFFSDRPAPVEVDEIFPVLPVFGLPQNNPVVGTRSNVADIMHITELFQNLFYHNAIELCPEHLEYFQELSFEDYLSDIEQEYPEQDVFNLFIKREDFVDYFKEQPFPSRSIKSKRSRKIVDFDESHEFWEIARYKKNRKANISEKVEPYFDKGLKLFISSPGLNKIIDIDYKAGQYFCPVDECEHEAQEHISLMHFSPYNALGACDECSGFGEILEYDEDKLWDKNKSVADGGVTLLNYKRFAGQYEELEYEMKKKKISLTKPIGDLPQKFFDLLYQGSGEYYGFDEYFAYLARKRYKMNVRIFIRNIQKGMTCPECNGTRLKSFAKQFFISENKEFTLNSLMSLNLFEILEKMKTLKNNNLFQNKEAQKLYLKIINILETANGIGLGHLSLQRKAKSLSAGEYQRLLLLKYLSYDGRDSLFVFDEPSLGLSDEEKKHLLMSFKKLISQNNTVVIVDHSLYFRSKSDYLIEMGPGSGFEGGEILYKGDKKSYKKSSYSHQLKPFLSKKRKWIKVEKPQIYNKTYHDFKIPVNEVTLVKGSSGTGKSACLINILANKLHYDCFDKYLNVPRGEFKKIENNTDFDDVIIVDANLNRYTSRSTVGSMTDLFGVVRKYYAKTKSAKALGLKDSHFSFNSDLGQCPKCEGKGKTIVEMQFLEDIELTCEDCKGKRLKEIYADLNDGRLTVHEAFSKPVSEVFEDFPLTPKYKRILEYIKILNLDYLSLNRPVQSLSGGEKQRIYLLSKLQKEVKNSIIFFENLSFGLSEKEMIEVSEFLQNLTLKGNTIILIDQDEFFQNIASYTLNFSR